MANKTIATSLPPLDFSLDQSHKHRLSIHYRIAAAVSDGRETIEFYRPATSAKAHRDTYVILRELRELGVDIEPMPCSNPLLNLFVLSNFENWK
ncbi:hypothetical protein HOS86_gp157 [Klebsiella phage vB_KpnM_KpS110]|uniref:Uncharacterized protein n=4 Tax=Taipeivirus TaxID=2731621 RepID=A0A5Q2F2V6_9CAUD|nr:hypothetical protein HOS54_gp167 [Klebsiella phage Menlow]YP_009798928.1 hypothetical protein HOS86_gp157 [Klebsiella phage vB_KpnM_KpS110]YP_009883492.1 hypothetical protein HYP92_gp160 [Klebsiella phage Magnus]YP_009884761.1 hypothetical protein HYQ02_gp174 [Klebsiella phage UPM 2146]UPW36036.1 hypothetical protein K751_00029 [Klebsiella phage K751]URG13691.1 hypothetical protein T751_00129 [Klebsiella phage T751]URG18011.1 hypothetical protein T765_00173 [Klebsiella phage T765]WJJ58845